MHAEWFPTMETDWHCLEAMAFPQAPLSLDRHLPRIPDILMGGDGAMSSTSSTSIKVCEQFIHSFAHFYWCTRIRIYWMVYTRLQTGDFLKAHNNGMEINEHWWPPYLNYILDWPFLQMQSQNFIDAII